MPSQLSSTTNRASRSTGRWNQKQKFVMSAWFCLSASSYLSPGARAAAFIRNSPLRPQYSATGGLPPSISRRAFNHDTAKSLLVSNRFTSARAAVTSSESETTTTTDATSSYDLLNKARGLDKYEPSTFESEIYQWWEHKGCFQPDAKQKASGEKKPYVLPMPPPNVTGRLHMGHAIFVALQDVLARFHRMRGRPVLWLPGTFVCYPRSK